MRRYIAGCSMAVCMVAAATAVASPVNASRDVPATTATVCTPGTWVQQPANVLPAMGGGFLAAAAVATPTLAWAVGFYETGSSYGSLIEKWTGGSSWSVVGTGGTNVSLSAVAAFGASSAFAVGTILSGGVTKAVVSRWNGSTWTRSVLAAPAGNKGASLFFVSGSSATDVWAVGDYYIHGEHLLVEHWNGTAWTRMTLPSAAKPIAQPSGLVSVGAGDIWIDGFSATEVSRLWHFNGAWTLETTPPDNAALAGSSDTDLWMVGAYSSGGTPLEHSDGSSWTPVDDNANGDINIDDIAVGASPSTVWEVGYAGVTSGLAETTSIAENGVATTAPALTGSLTGIGTGSGRAFAVGGTNAAGTGEPIVLASCD
jgi:hypothetical protein